MVGDESVGVRRRERGTTPDAMPGAGGVSRRSVVVAAAWAVPVVSVAISTPAMAASQSFDLGLTQLSAGGLASRPFDQTPVRVTNGVSFYAARATYDSQIFFQNIGAMIPAGATVTFSTTHYPVTGASIVLQSVSTVGTAYGFLPTTVVPVGPVVLTGAPLTAEGTASRTFRFDVPIPAETSTWRFQMRFVVGDVTTASVTGPGRIAASIVMPAGTVDSNPANDTVSRSDISYIPRVVAPGVVTFSPGSYTAAAGVAYGAITGTVSANGDGVRPAQVALVYAGGATGPAVAAVNAATGAFSVAGVRASTTVGSGSVTASAAGFTSGAASLVATRPTGTATFNATGADQFWTVPYGVTQVTARVNGARGGRVDSTVGATNGRGGLATGVLSVRPGEALTIMVGVISATSSYGGGGRAGTGPDGRDGGVGGGLSAIWRGPAYTGTPFLVAGGGGGSSGFNSRGYAGGPGGGTSGGTATGPNPGAGGTQTAGGQGSGGSGTGTRWTGGNGVNDTIISGGSGGGGGWYGGGGGGSRASGGGGGGSSYVNPTLVTNGQTTVGGGPDYPNTATITLTW